MYESGPGNPTSTTLPYAWADAIDTTAFFSIGTHTLSAQYSGDSYYAASSSPASTVVVGPAQPSFLTYGWGTPSPVYVGQTVNPTATLYGSDKGVAPTGTMMFFDNGTALTSTVTYKSQNAPGILTANTTYTFTTPGNHNLTIQYSGDTNYTSATNGLPNTLFVQGPVSVTPSGAVVVPSPGQPGMTNLLLTPNQGFTGIVTLTCGTDPTAMETACGFASGSGTVATLQININASGATVGFNVTTTAPHPLARNRSALLFSVGGLGTAAVFLLPLGHRRRSSSLAITWVVTMLLLLGGCGGSSVSGGGGGGSNMDPGTAVGTYQFTVTSVTGTGSSAISVATPITVSVQ